MRIQAVFCDVHPNDKLTETAVKMEGRYEQQKTLRCTHADCDRHFHYDFGYFDFAGPRTDFGDLAAKPKCRQSHDLIYMLLTRIDEAPVYACFHPDCTSTVPYEAASVASR